MKHFSKLAITFMCIVGIFTSAIPVQAADSYELAWNEMAVLLKPNTYQRVSKYTYIRDRDGEVTDEMVNVYQVNIPYDAILTIQYSGTKKDNSLYITRDGSYSDFQYVTSGKAKSAKKSYVVEKGKYYIFNQNEKKPVRLKYSIKKIKAKNRGNYVRKKAVKLKRNKKETVYQNFSKNYYRWYKINVTKEQKIQLVGKITSSVGEVSDESISVAGWVENGTFLMEYPFCDVFIFDSKGDIVLCKSTKKGIITQKKVPKGTYYLKVNCGRVKKGWGEYVEFRWK